MNKVILYNPKGEKAEADASELQFRVSAYGLLRKGDMVLAQKDPNWGVMSLPGGGLEKHETPIEALKREFKEETGLEVEIKGLVDVAHSFFWYSSPTTYCNSLQIFYEVQTTGGELISESNEEGDSDWAGWVSVAEIINNKSMKESYLNILRKMYGLD